MAHISTPFDENKLSSCYGSNIYIARTRNQVEKNKLMRCWERQAIALKKADPFTRRPVQAIIEVITNKSGRTTDILAKKVLAETGRLGLCSGSSLIILALDHASWPGGQGVYEVARPHCRQSCDRCHS